MQIKINLVLVGLLLSLAPINNSCTARTASTQTANAAKSPLAKAQNDPNTSLGWKRYSIDDAPAFSLVLPSEPVRSSAGATHTYMSASSAGIYGVAYLVDMTAAARHSEGSGAEFLIDNFLKPFAVNYQQAQGAGNDFHIQLLVQRETSISGIKGFEQDFSVGDSQGRARIIRIGQDGFCVVAIWRANAPPSELNTFFDSVKVESTQPSDSAKQ